MQKEKRSSPPELGHEELVAIVNSANAGDIKALRRLQTILDDHPEIWQTTGDLARHAELAIVSLIARKDALLAESVQRSLKALRKEVCPPNPTPLEKLLVERVVITWMRIQYIETNYASTANLSLAEKKFALQQRESAQRLFDAAVKSLRTVQSKLGQVPGPASAPSHLKIHKPDGPLRGVRAAV